MRNILFYVICALIAAVPAFAGNSKKSQSASDDTITQARLAAAAAEEGNTSAFADEATSSLTVNENAQDATGGATTEASAGEDTKVLSQEEIRTMKESEIPLVGSGKQQKKSESSPWFRLIATIGVLGVLFVGVKVGLKKYTRRSNNPKLQGTKIRVVTNHHIGPKKSLMIVNVAGESLLLGVTDQNISILKNLSLLEEELPADIPSTFAGAINETFVETKNLVAAPAAQETEDDFAIQGLAQIKDKVSSRLKNMRQI